MILKRIFRGECGSRCEELDIIRIYENEVCCYHKYDVETYFNIYVWIYDFRCEILHEFVYEFMSELLFELRCELICGITYELIYEPL